MSIINKKKQNTPLIEKYIKKGFKNHFKFEGGHLLDTDNNNHYMPEDIQILEEHKLDSHGQPTEDILMVFRTKNFTKGLFIMDEQAREDLLLKKFFKAIPEQNLVQSESINLSTEKIDDK